MRFMTLNRGAGRTAWTRAAASMALALGAAGCGAGSAADTAARPDVITAVGAENEYADVLSQIGGRYVRVSAILDNPNTDPHTFEASPQVAREVSSARLIVQNGVGYDSWIDKMESSSAGSGRKVIIAQHLLGLPDSAPNPHLWYDPKTMPAVARAVAAALSDLQPAHKAYFAANLARFEAALKPWLSAIAQFKSKHHGITAATIEPVADYLLAAMGIRNLTPWTFQADIMNGVDPAPEDIALENGFFGKHRVRFFAYNQQVTDALTGSIRQHAIKDGVPVVAVYETMPARYDYQSWMLAEVHAIEKAVTSRTSTQSLR